MNVGKITKLATALLLLAACKPPQKTTAVVLPQPAKDSAVSVSETGSSRTDAFLNDMLMSHPEYFSDILARKDELCVQVIYTRIDRGKNGRAKFTDYYFNVNPDTYFYPASTVKLPVAVLALQKLNELKQAGLDMNTTMITDHINDQLTGVCNDPTAADGRPTIAHYIKKIFLVSDNDAFNRLYEFLGQEYINSTLHGMGFTKTQILHRLSLALHEADNRKTNAIRFLSPSGELVYEKPLMQSQWIPEKRNIMMGKGYMKGDQLISEPFNFSAKNRLVLEDLHSMIKSIYFPESVSEKQRFNLTAGDYNFLRKYMSMLPHESDYPSYDSTEHWPSYVKFLLYGSEKGELNPGIRIFNKVGDAYGFLIDAAYIADFKNKTEFILSAAIHCNSDGVYNDDKYDYDSVGFPFMKHLGQVIYEYELKRDRKVKPDLSTLQFSYKQ